MGWGKIVKSCDKPRSWFWFQRELLWRGYWINQLAWKISFFLQLGEIHKTFLSFLKKINRINQDFHATMFVKKPFKVIRLNQNCSFKWKAIFQEKLFQFKKRKKVWNLNAFTVGNLTCDRPTFHCLLRPASHKLFIFNFVFIIALYSPAFVFPLRTKLFFYSASVVEIAQNRKRRFVRLE